MADEPVEGDLDDAAAVFDRLRGRLFGVAYRMLGTVADAEDVLQDVWIRWQRADRRAVHDATAYLVTATTRVSIDAIAAARSRRETYIGEWLPSPVDTSTDPTLGAERGEALELAVLLMMERLTPAERAAYVLREAFDYPYPAIAQIVRTTEPNARQLVSRSRRHLAGVTHRRVDETQHRRLFEAFLRAAHGGDVAALEGLLAEDVTSTTDGAGMHRTARRPITGKPTVIRFLLGVAQWFWDDLTIRPVHVNGRESALLLRGDQPYALFSATTDDASVHQVLWIMSPEKLAALSPALGALH